MAQRKFLEIEIAFKTIEIVIKKYRRAEEIFFKSKFETNALKALNFFLIMQIMPKVDKLEHSEAEKMPNLSSLEFLDQKQPGINLFVFFLRIPTCVFGKCLDFVQNIIITFKITTNELLNTNYLS
jgi:hypothetical protein